MKIVHTESSLGWGGQEIRILEESRGMIERGHEVTILCPPHSPIHQEALRRGIPVEGLPIERKRFKGLRALRNWLAHRRIDILNTHSSTDSWLAAIACKTLGDPPAIVRTRHISAPIPDNFLSRWLYNGAVSLVVTTGEALRRQLIEACGVRPDRVTSVPTGIDTERFAPGDKALARSSLGLDPLGHYIGIVATLRSWKGHLFLLDAFASLAAPDWQLVIVGEGPMRGSIEAKIAELGLGARVKLVGQQDSPEDWLRALDIFCLPSYANEGVPQAVIQAMLTALPIVTTPVGAILEAVNEATAVIVPPRDSEALAGALGRLMSDAEFARRLGCAARDRALQQFSREMMLDRMEHVFHTTMNQRS